MNRILRILFRSLPCLALASGITACDSSPSAEGSSSETHTSLQALATRLDGLRAEALAARSAPVAGRSAAAQSDTSSWTDLWASSSSVGYLKKNGEHRILSATADSNTFTSESTYTAVQMSFTANRYARGFGRFWWQVGACADSLPPPPHCRQGLPGTHQMNWASTIFRNGLVLTPVDSVAGGSMSAYVIDGRWTIRQNSGNPDPDNLWWDIFENGRLIGRGMQRGRQFEMSLAQDTYLNSLATMTIYDLSGGVVAPERSAGLERMVFPEDSLGLTIDSMAVDSVAGALRIRLSWRFDPRWGLPDAGTAKFAVAVYDWSCPAVDSCGLLLAPDNPILSGSGSHEVSIPLRQVRIGSPELIAISVSSTKDSLVGTRAQTRQHFFASIDTAWPGAVEAP